MIERVVSKDEFFQAIGPLNTEGRVIGKHPYTYEYWDKERHALVGRINYNADGQKLYALADTRKEGE